MFIKSFVICHIKKQKIIKNYKRNCEKLVSDRLEWRDAFFGFIYFVKYPSLSHDAWAMNEGKDFIEQCTRQWEEFFEGK